MNMKKRLGTLLFAVMLTAAFPLAASAEATDDVIVDNSETEAESSEGETEAESGEGETEAETGEGETEAESGEGETEAETGEEETVIEIASYTEDGLAVTVKADSDTYEEGAAASITLEVTNTTDAAMENISVSTVLPDTLELTGEEAASLEIESIDAQSTVTLAFKVKVRADDTPPSGNGDTNPSTGVGFPILPAAISALVLGAASLLILKKRKSGMKLLVLLVGVSVLSQASDFGAFAANVSEPEMVAEQFEVPYSVTFGETEYNLKAVVDYYTEAVGGISGRLVAADEDSDPTNNAAIEGATISLYRLSSTFLVPETADYTLTTAADGNYGFDGLLTGTYVYQVESDGYLTASGAFGVQNDVTTYLGTIEAITEEYSEGTGTVSGSVINAFTGDPITDTEMTVTFLRALDFTPGEAPGHVADAEITVSDGEYFAELPAGYYTAVVSGEGFMESSNIITVLGGVDSEERNLIVSPQLQEGNIRIVLSWGENPSDLDSHFTGPSATNPNGFHIYYTNQGYVMGENVYTSDFEAGTDYDTALDIDDTSSFGPETTTVYKPMNGTYNFYVQDYTNLDLTDSVALKNSQAIVRVYDHANGLLAEYNVPTNGGASTIWHVFSITHENGEWKNPVPVNQMLNEPSYPSDVGEDS